MSASPWWAWARDGSAMHAWPLSEAAVQLAKAGGVKHDTICGRTLGIGERPARRPNAEAELNHCADCWAILNPRTSVFLATLVQPEIRRVDHWRRSG